MKKILGIGNALVDIMTQLKDDDFLEKYELPKGSMQLIDRDYRNKILEATKDLKSSISSGGSAANTINGLAGLGASTAFIGTVGNDKYGNYFIEDLQKNNVEPIILKSDNDSGISIAFVSPDSERTMATYLGAALELSADVLNEDWFKGYEYLHIEGYLVLNHDLITKAAKFAKNNGVQISLDLASYNVVEDNLEFLKDFINNYVDIIFANEEEATSFTGKEPEDALDELAGYSDIAIVKVGKHGSFIKCGSEKVGIDPIQANAVDTTGAGDAYAAGFLYGLSNNSDLKTCGNIGAVLSGKVIEEIGAKLSDEKWKEVKTRIDS